MSEQPTGMDLKKFVKDVILEVIRGVNEAADNVREAHSAEALRGAVNPRSDAATRDIEFDVALTVSRKQGAKLGIRVPVVSADGSVDHGEQRTNRVKFSVPVAFASQPVGSEYTDVGAPSPAPGYDASEDGCRGLIGPPVSGPDPSSDSD